MNVILNDCKENDIRNDNLDRIRRQCGESTTIWVSAWFNIQIPVFHQVQQTVFDPVYRKYMDPNEPVE